MASSPNGKEPTKPDIRRSSAHTLVSTVMATSHMPTAKQKSGFLEGLKLFAFVILVAFLAFVAGGVSTYMKAPGVGDFMQRLSLVMFYLYESNVNTASFDPFWNPAHMPGPEGEIPVVLNDPALAGRGYNLVVSAHAQEATLIDMDGNPVHKWARRFDEIWDKAPQLPDYENEDRDYWVDNIYWRRAHLYENGDILAIFETPFRTPYGLGLAKLDKESNVIWKLDDNVHHDVDVAPNGDIFIVGQLVNEKGYAEYPVLTPPFIDDTIITLAPDGRLKKELSVIEAFLNSDYAPMLALMNTNLLGDVMHTNTIQYIDAKTAEKFDFAEEGYVLISMREMNVIAVLDPIGERIVWAQTGMWRGQHEPVMLDNGRILLFDNQSNRGGSGGATRIIEFDPTTGSIEWSFAGNEKEPLESLVYGSIQRLGSGNTMVVESTNGRAMEVTPDGRVVWDYRSPHRKTEDGQVLVMPILDVVRIEPGILTFLE
jgi:hypothetical protein